ncbi:hypothetical protein [Dyella sp. 2RAB6]|uniref:hypothetical protein n=1 Tax=Dyella sp. 2RAB6 TaxID=3232992 RepID=UPI003F8DF869
MDERRGQANASRIVLPSSRLSIIRTSLSEHHYQNIIIRTSLSEHRFHAMLTAQVGP